MRVYAHATHNIKKAVNLYLIMNVDPEDIKLEKKVVKFIVKPTKSGPRYYFSIPTSYIKNKLIDPEKTYVVYLAVTDEKIQDSD